MNKLLVMLVLISLFVIGVSSARGADIGKLEAIPTLGVSELEAKITSLSGETVRLKFICRGEIRRAGNEWFSTELYDKDLNHVSVVFPQEGYDSMKHIRQYTKLLKSPPFRERIQGVEYAYVTIEARDRLNLKGGLSGEKSSRKVIVVGRSAERAW